MRPQWDFTGEVKTRDVSSAVLVEMVHDDGEEYKIPKSASTESTFMMLLIKMVLALNKENH